MVFNDAITVYVGIFWDDLAQDLKHKIISLNARHVILAARNYLAALNIPEEGYEAFLLEAISAWDGTETHFTTVANGKLVLFSGLLEDALVPRLV